VATVAALSLARSGRPGRCGMTRERRSRDVLGGCHHHGMHRGRLHTEYGDRDTALSAEILRKVVGSGVHGIAIPGTDDHDEMGVFIEPPNT
jgi:hypothetical protein